jgi:ribosomal protein S18 acetylase RimI-like enzyme
VSGRSDIVIRRLRPADGAQLADLLSEAFAEEFTAGGTDRAAVLHQLRSAGWAQQPGVRALVSLLGARFAYFVAADHDRVVGSTVVGGSRLPVISSVAVLPAYRRAGIAEALVAHAQRFAVEHGRDRVVLDVLAHNTPALRLYEKLGYAEYHRFRVYTLAAPPAVLPAALPRRYRLEPLSPKRVAAFGPVERASLPARYFEVAPTLRDRYVHPRSIQWLERVFGGLRADRRALVHDGRTVGYLVAAVGAGQREGRIDFPLVHPDATEALAPALARAVQFIERYGRDAVRLDLSDDRPDHHRIAENLGFHHRWTFIQMVNWLSKPLRIPVRVGALQRLPHEQEEGLSSEG